MTTGNAAELKQDFNKQTNTGIWIGILLIVLGIGAIALPNITTIVAETWIAIILGSAGASNVFYAIQTRSEGFIWKLILGILYVGTGIMLFVYPLTGILSLTLLLGSFLFTEGVFESILAFQLKPRQNWGWVLANGIITLFLGALVWFEWPFDAPWLIGTLVGVSVLSTGVSRLMLSLNGGKMTGSLPNPTDPAPVSDNQAPVHE